MKNWFIKHQFALIITGIAVLVIVGIGLFTWLILSNNDVVEGERYYPQGQYAVLDLGSRNCEPCDKLKPIFENLNENYGENIDFVVFDISYTTEGAAVANAYKVNVMPTLLFLDKNGKEVKRVIGFRTQEQIEEILKELRWIA